MSSQAARDIMQKTICACLVAVIMGGAGFYVRTTTEIALIQAELTDLKDTSGAILSAIEQAHPRQ